MLVLPFQLNLAAICSPLSLVSQSALPAQAQPELGSAQAGEGESVMFRASCTQWCIEAHQERVRSGISFGLGAQQLWSRGGREFPRSLQKVGPVLLWHGRRREVSCQVSSGPLIKHFGAPSLY